MRKGNFIYRYIVYLIIDCISLIGSFFASNFIVFKNINLLSRPINYINILLWMIGVLIYLELKINHSDSITNRSMIKEIICSIRMIVYSFLIIGIVFFIFKIGSLFSRKTLFLTYLFFFIFSLALKFVYREMVLTRIKKDENLSKKVLIVSQEKEISALINSIENEKDFSYLIKGICTIDSNRLKFDKYYCCEKKEIVNYCINNNIDNVFINSDINNFDKKIIDDLVKNGIEVNISILKLIGTKYESEKLKYINMYNTLSLNSFTFSNSQMIYFIFKRLFDIFFSIFGLVILIPLSIIVKVSYLFENDRDSIFYKQKRVGYNGKFFSIYKFRSMVTNADKELEILLNDDKYKKEWDLNKKISNDPRVTKVGNFLRKTSLDEFPQFINVLKGDMSLIGPRPLLDGELNDKNGLKLYVKVKPGITGWWACNGRSEISYEERLSLEYYYVKNCSFKIDIICLIKSIFVILSRKGAK